MPADRLEPAAEEPPPRTRAEVRARGLALGGLAAILLVIVAAATSGGFALGEREGSGGLVSPRLPGFAVWVLVPLLLLSVVASITVLTQVVVGRQMTSPARRPVWAQLATLILVVLALVALQQAGILGRADEDRQRGAAEATARPPAPALGADRVTRSTAFGVVVTVVLAFVLLAILLLMFSVIRKERGLRMDLDDPETRVLLEGVEAGIDDLATIEDPRAAVIACYARLESSLAAAGLTRKESEAPLEFLERVLVEKRVLDASASRLTALFERARFSSHEIDEPMRRDAADALRRARAQIRGVS